jgi:hypothetical protein
VGWRNQHRRTSFAQQVAVRQRGSHRDEGDAVTNDPSIPHGPLLPFLVNDSSLNRIVLLPDAA